MSTVASVAVAVVGVAAVLGAGWWLFTSFGAAFFADTTASSVYTAHAAVLLIALGAAAIGIARGSYFAWLAALACCAATACSVVAQFVTSLLYGYEFEGGFLILDIVLMLPAVVPAATIVVLARSAVREWCTSRTGVAWLVPAAGLVIAGVVGAVLTAYPHNVTTGVGAAAAVVAGLIAFAATRRQASDSKPD